MVPTLDPERLGRVIKERRLALTMSQVDLAKLSGVSQSTLNRMEAGEIESPGLQNLIKIAKALRFVSLDAFIRGDGVIAPPEVTAMSEGELVAVLVQMAHELAEMRRALRTVDLFEWAGMGDPRDAGDGGAQRVGFQEVPDGKEALLGQRGFAVRVRGASMESRGLKDGNIVFVNPDHNWHIGSIVLARVLDLDGERRNYVKEVAQDQLGRTILRSNGDGETSQIPGSEFQIIGPVMFWISVEDAEPA